MTLAYSPLRTPFGQMFVVTNQAGALVKLAFPNDPPEPGLDRDDRRCEPAVCQLNAYFAGTLRDFTLPMAPPGTDFQKLVWAELSRIPFGTTISYGELARRIGRPKSSRAVGRANATNPIPIVVPCHRVIGSSGTLTGYAGGLDLKLGLLKHEGIEVVEKARPSQAGAEQASWF